MKMKILGRAWRRVAAAVALLAAAACGDLVTGPAPEGDLLPGIDVSHWQGAIDWPRVADDGVAFAFIKATEGGDYVDPRFAANWAGAAQAGVMRGAYHFYRPQPDAAAQAEHFLRTVQLRAGDLPPVLDVEVTDGRSASAIAAGVRTWLETVERATGRRPIVYTRAGFWNQVGGGFGAYPLWVAHYGVAAPASRRTGRAGPSGSIPTRAAWPASAATWTSTFAGGWKRCGRSAVRAAGTSGARGMQLPAVPCTCPP